MALPRRWLVVAAVLMVVPWLVVAALFGMNALGAIAAPVSRPAPAPTTDGVPGPWGRLVITPVVVSPPLEYIGDDWGGRADAPDRWRFSTTSTDALAALLRSCGLDTAAVESLRATAQPDADGGIVVTPSLELVGALTPEIRARLYGELAKNPLNFDQAQSFRFLGNSAEAWLSGSLISGETRRLLEPLFYRQGDFLHFADVEWIRARVADREERRRLAKTLLRQNTLLVRLTVSDPGEVEGLSRYWGRGGRRTDLRPLLESLVADGNPRSIDIAHLLPSFAREHLYRYPKLTMADMDRPLLANCLWSSLNFFNAKPDDRFLDPSVALETLRNDYFVVESGFELGDIIAFVDEGGNLFHVGVHLADSLVFSKNGTSPVAPWAIQTVQQITGYYRVRSAAPRLIYHRAKAF